MKYDMESNLLNENTRRNGSDLLASNKNNGYCAYGPCIFVSLFGTVIAVCVIWIIIIAST